MADVLQDDIALPLSPEQQAILSVHRSESSADGGRLVLLATLKSSEPERLIEAERLFAAVERVLQAHHVFRSAFARNTQTGAFLQRLLPDMPRPLTEVIDLRAHGDEAQKEAFGAWYATFIAEPLNTEQGNLVRASIVRTDNGSAMLALCVSALVADRVSLQTIFGQLIVAYEHGRAPDAGDVFQYSQFVRWRRELALGAESDHGRPYWSDYLQAHQTTLPPRLAYRTSGSESHNLALVHQQMQVIDSALVAQLAAMSDALGVTPETLLQAVWWLLLARLTNFERFACGWQHDCRRDYELMRGAVGVYDKVLPIIVDARPDELFKDWVARLSTITQAHTDAQEYWVVEAPPMATHLTVGFAYSDYTASNDGGLASWELCEWPGAFPCFELAMHVALGTSQIQLAIEADSGRYTVSAAQRLIEQFCTLLRSAVEAPDACLAELSMLSSEERGILLGMSGAKADFGPLTVAEHILSWAERTPDAPAIEAQDQQLSYWELAGRVNRMARWLQAQGVRQGDRIALSLPRSPQLIVAMLASWKLRASYLPLEPEWPAARRKAVLADAEPALVLYEDATSFADVPFPQVALIAEEISAFDDAPLPGYPELSDVAYVLYTSGSTGQPKGAVIDHAALLNYVAAASQAMDLGRSHRWALTSSVAADLGNTALFGALFNGACLVIAGPQDVRDAHTFASFMTRHEIDGLKIVPSHLQALLECEAPCLPRTLVLGGEAAPRALIGRVRQIEPQCAIYNHYGPTETTVGVMVHQFSSLAERHGTVPLTHALSNNRVIVLDESLRLVPIGAIGHLYIGGAQLCRGYLRREAPDAFIADPFHPHERLYRTGDLAWVRPEGGIQLAGRADHQVKIRGFRVEPAEVEAVLLTCPAVRQAVVMGLPGAQHGLELVAFVVIDDEGLSDGEALQREITAALSARLPAYMVPARHVVLTELPRLANGKIDRVALAAQANDARTSRPRTPPRNELEAALVACMSEVLGCETIGIEDDFFELGGDSLIAIRLAARVRRLLQIEMEPGLIFDSPSVGELAAILQSQHPDMLPLASLKPDKPDSLASPVLEKAS